MVVRRILVLIAAASFVGACAEPFDAPSAYETQRFLCDPQNAQAYAEEIAACRQQHDADGGCGGVLSFKGTLGGRPVVVESRLSSARLSVLPQGAGQAPLLDEVELLGASPYFDFDAKFRSVGGALAADGGSRDLIFAAAPNRLADPLQDDQVNFQLRLTGADSVGYAGAPGGNATFDAQSPTDIVGSFSGAFGSETDVLDGCFHVLPLEQDAESAPIQ